MGKSIHDLREMLCEELEKMTEQRSLSPDRLKLIDMLTHSIKSIDTIIAMEEYDDGDSYARGNSRGSYARGNSRDSYERGNSRSYARRGGRYSEGYSGDDHLMQKLEDMLQESGSDKEREMIKRFMEQMR